MSTFLPILVPLWLTACALIAAEAAARKRRIPRKEFLALGLPQLLPTITLLLGFIGLACVLEVVSRHAGLGADVSWVGKYSGSALAIRIVAVALLAPLGEELLFRGAIFGLIAPKSAALAVLVTAAIFAGAHFQYSALGMTLVFIDGLYYGLARARSGSTLLTIVMHCAANSFAVYQRLH